MGKRRITAFICAVLSAALIWGAIPARQIFAEEYTEAAEPETKPAETVPEAEDPQEEQAEVITGEAAEETEAAAFEEEAEPADFEEETEAAVPEEETEAADPEEETEPSASEEGPETADPEDETAEEPAAEDVVIPEEEDEAELVTETEEALSDTAQPDGAQTFVERCYRVILGREPDEAGLQDWTDRIRNGNKTAADIMKGFFGSAEYKQKNYSDSKYIEVLYRAAFNRTVDSAGLANRKAELEYGFTKNYLLKYVTDSSEFKNKCSALDIAPGTVSLTDTLDRHPYETRYVYDLYKNVLGRKPDRGGQVKNVNALLESGARPLVVKFFRSAEYTGKKTSDEQFIRDVFKGALKRNAEQSAVDNRLKSFENGLSRMYVLKNVLSSSEFEGKTATWKVKAGTFPDSVLEERDKDPKTTRFVLLSYKNGLKRTPSASELNKACGLMLSGDRKAFDQLHHIAFSPEAKSKSPTDADYIKMLFNLVIQRAPTKNELSAYKDMLGGFTNREEVFDRLAFGEEGIKTAKKYGYSIKDKYADWYDKAVERLDAVGWDLKAAYDWICTKEWSRVGVFDEQPSRWHADYFFTNDTGDCYAMAGAFYEMAKIMKYDVHQIAGHIVFMSGALGKHSWTEVVVNGTTYIVDPDTEVEVGLNAWFVYYGQSGTLKYAEYTRMN